MAVLLTGGTGFLGRHVLTQLHAGGKRVIVYGRRMPPAMTGVRFVEGDITSANGLRCLPWSEITEVVHLAAAGVKASCRDWPNAVAVNVVGTQRLWDAISTAGYSPDIFYARTFYEDLVSGNPELLGNPYIATKWAAHELAAIFARDYPGGFVAGNLFQIYGPGDSAASVLSYAVAEFRIGRQAVFGSGTGLRDWIHVSDAASAILASLATTRGEKAVYDIGTGELRSIREMVLELHRLFPGAPFPVFDPVRDRNDLRLSAKATRFPPQWRPTMSVDSGLTSLRGSL